MNLPAAFGSPPEAPAALAAVTIAREFNAPSFLPMVPLLRCPVDGTQLAWDKKSGLSCASRAHTFAIEADIPCLLMSHERLQDEPQIANAIKGLHEKSPALNCRGYATRDNLKADVTVLARMLNEQISHSASIIEIGCGTGQVTNFLGMSWGRTVIGADLIMDSLKVAKELRDRFAINNSHFLQMDLFRPSLAPASFDVVIVNGVLHHTSDWFGAFRSISRLVKPGGVIIVELYNWLGRLPTLWWRPFADRRRRPYETRHSMSEILEWFDAEEFEFTASIPTIGDCEFSERMPLFEAQATGNRRDRGSSELEMLLTGGRDGGLFVMIGRKRR